MPLVGREPFVEQGGALAIAERGAHLRQLVHGVDPVGVARKLIEAPGGQVVEDGPRLGQPAEVAAEQRQTTAKGRHGGVLFGEGSDRRFDLVETALLAAQPKELNTVDEQRVRGGAPAELQGLVDQALGVGEPAGEHRAHRRQDADAPAMERLPELLRPAPRGAAARRRRAAMSPRSRASTSRQ